MDSGWAFTFKLYSPGWKRQRRLFIQHLNPVATAAFLNNQVIATAHLLLRSLLQAPSRLEAHIKYAAAHLVLGIAYGCDVKSINDPIVEVAERMINQVGQGVSPGAWLVNVFPWRESYPHFGSVGAYKCRCYTQSIVFLHGVRELRSKLLRQRLAGQVRSL